MQDKITAMATGNRIYLNTEISEEAIIQFCRNCDLLNSDGICRLGPKSQARYANRKSCGWASIDGNDGLMTEAGFTPFEK